jgi:hypothetical protein
MTRVSFAGGRDCQKSFIGNTPMNVYFLGVEKINATVFKKCRTQIQRNGPLVHGVCGEAHQCVTTTRFT